MSRILRRPMFRGGPVDSRGTGITSGLMDEGQIGGGSIYGEQMPDGRYGFQNPMSLEDILKQQLSDIESRRSYEAPKTSQEIEKEYMSKLKPYEEPTFFDPDTGMGAGAPGSYAQGQLDYFQALSSPTYKTAFLTKREKEEADKKALLEQKEIKRKEEEKINKITTLGNSFIKQGLNQKAAATAVDYVYKEAYKTKEGVLLTEFDKKIIEVKNSPEELLELIQFLNNKEKYLQLKQSRETTKKTETTFKEILKNKVNKKTGFIALFFIS